jgi:hypothetical protein
MARPLSLCLENQESGNYAPTLRGDNRAAPSRSPAGRAPSVRERYGRALQQQLAAAELTVRHAHALAKFGADHEDLTALALITVAQQRALDSLLEMDEVRPADLNAIANLTRAAIAQQWWAAESKERDEPRHTPAAKP